ncbi:hypothetical protein ULF88_24395 [Halopseudomonas pachastrellae]|nr:hypothetical protein [Halopseudomonas pachastrellae]
MPRQLNQYLHFGRYLARRFIEDNCIKNAAARPIPRCLRWCR